MRALRRSHGVVRVGGLAWAQPRGTGVGGPMPALRPNDARRRRVNLAQGPRRFCKVKIDSDFFAALRLLRRVCGSISVPRVHVGKALHAVSIWAPMKAYPTCILSLISPHAREEGSLGRSKICF